MLSHSLFNFVVCSILCSWHVKGRRVIFDNVYTFSVSLLFPQALSFLSRTRNQFRKKHCFAQFLWKHRGETRGTFVLLRLILLINHAHSNPYTLLFHHRFVFCGEWEYEKFKRVSSFASRLFMGWWWYVAHSYYYPFKKGINFDCVWELIMITRNFTCNEAVVINFLLFMTSSGCKRRTRRE